MSDTELDRIWARIDEQDKRIDALEVPRKQRVDKLHADLGLPYTHDVHGRGLTACVDPGFAYVACAKCSNRVEKERECYVVPTCYACLPPPPPIPVAQLRGQQAPSPDYATSEPQDACGCPASDELRGTLKRIEAIVSEMLPPSGVPGPAQRLLIRVRDELGMGAP